MKKLIYTVTSAMIGFLFIWSCEKPVMLSEIPEIKFKSLSLKHDTVFEGDTAFKTDNIRVKLTFSLIDGDGDIGLPTSDSINKNLFVTLYEKIDGEFKEVNLLGEYKTPYQEPEGQDKTLKADYEVTIDYPTKFFTYDTIKYSFYIFDRKMHKSNTAESPEIPGNTRGVID